jgi:hypothetical protein
MDKGCRRVVERIIRYQQNTAVSCINLTVNVVAVLYIRGANHLASVRLNVISRVSYIEIVMVLFEPPSYLLPYYRTSCQEMSSKRSIVRTSIYYVVVYVESYDQMFLGITGTRHEDPVLPL